MPSTRRRKLDEAYQRYYLARHICEDDGMAPNDFELHLWNELEDELAEIWVNEAPKENLAPVHGVGRLAKRNVANRQTKLAAKVVKAGY
jgi:hypothetical protein